MRNTPLDYQANTLLYSKQPVIFARTNKLWHCSLLAAVRDSVICKAEGEMKKRAEINETLCEA